MQCLTVSASQSVSQSVSVRQSLLSQWVSRRGSSMIQQCKKIDYLLIEGTVLYRYRIGGSSLLLIDEVVQFILSCYRFTAREREFVPFCDLLRSSAFFLYHRHLLSSVVCSSYVFPACLLDGRMSTHLACHNNYCFHVFIIWKTNFNFCSLTSF